MDLASVLENIRLVKLNVLDVLRPSNEVHFVLLATRTKLLIRPQIKLFSKSTVDIGALF